MMETLIAFLQSGYGTLVGICTAAGVLWGGAKAVGALRVWVKKRIENHKARRAVPCETLALIKELRAEMDKLHTSLDEVKEQGKLSADAIATLQNKELMFAYDYYGVQHHKISTQQKTTLGLMLEQYRDDSGHNHIPSDWEERINSAPMVGEVVDG